MRAALGTPTNMTRQAVSGLRLRGSAHGPPRSAIACCGSAKPFSASPASSNHIRGNFAPGLLLQLSQGLFGRLAVSYSFPQKQGRQRTGRAQTCRLSCSASADGTTTPVTNGGSPGLGPINKHTIVMDDGLYEYLLRHTREQPVLRSLREATSTMHGSRMQTPPEQAGLLTLLVELLGARRAIEVGVYTGYSSVAIALALPDDGRLVACERDERVLEVARQYWAEAGVAHKVDCRCAPAATTLDALLAAGEAGTYDFAYVDADKRGYMAYYEQCLQLVRVGGLIALDNVLWKGKVARTVLEDKQTAALQELNAFLVQDGRCTVSILPVGDGLALCRRRV